MCRSLSAWPSNEWTVIFFESSFSCFFSLSVKFSKIFEIIYILQEVVDLHRTNFWPLTPFLKIRCIFIRCNGNANVSQRAYLRFFTFVWDSEFIIRTNCGYHQSSYHHKQATCFNRIALIQFFLRNTLSLKLDSEYNPSSLPCVTSAHDGQSSFDLWLIRR